jgi:hypothetical protein
LCRKNIEASTAQQIPNPHMKQTLGNPVSFGALLALGQSDRVKVQISDHVFVTFTASARAVGGESGRDERGSGGPANSRSGPFGISRT